MSATVIVTVLIMVIALFTQRYVVAVERLGRYLGSAEGGVVVVWAEGRCRGAGHDRSPFRRQVTIHMIAMMSGKNRVSTVEAVPWSL